ncbi:NfeD family protein [Salininema proteolyticum]|uniref:Nodulation protein NfeD n=1 Tax=Salininema proteolyticum TaxID=1607685 RepID=A0ABV8TYA2_9ACTN
MVRRAASLFRALLLGALAWLCLASPGQAAQETVLVATVEGPITPVTVRLLEGALEEASDSGAEALLVEMDTPGGLDTSMRDIVQSFLSSEVPVIVYVSPPGGRAASAGTLITMSANVAAMAPGTTIGAATPVDLESGEAASDKVVNDAAAYAESIADLRGRSAEFAGDAVREGTAVDAEQAVEIGAVDLVAGDRSDLLEAVDGTEVDTAVGPRPLATAGAAVEEYDPGWVQGLLEVIAHPNLAFLFISIGTLAVIYELATPGMGLGGTAGAILLILGFFALSVLPVTLAGVLLLILAAALFAAEAATPEMGVFATGGAISLVIAGLFLFEGPAQVSLGVLLPTAAVVGGGSVLAGRLAWKAKKLPPSSGRASMIGRTAVVEAVAGGPPRVFFEGAWWTVRSESGPLTDGQRVAVSDVDGLTLVVRPEDEEEDHG